MEYYWNIGGSGNRIPNYFMNVFYPWVVGNDEVKKKIEDKFLGVHEYLPSGRGPCYSSKFDDDHPYYIQKSLDKLRKVFEEEINYVEQKLQSR